MKNTIKSANCLHCDKKSSCFRSLTSKDLSELQESRVELKYKAGEIICKQGAFATQISYLYSGMVKIYLENNQDNNLILNIIPPGQLIGLPSLYNKRICHYTASALEDSIVCSIDINVFDKYIKSNGEFASQIIYELNKNTSISYKRILSLTQKQLNGRIADSLLYLANDVYSNDSFKLTLSRKDMAELSSTSCESITRVLSKFKAESIINIKGKDISILDKERLQNISIFG